MEPENTPKVIELKEFVEQLLKKELKPVGLL